VVGATGSRHSSALPPELLDGSREAARMAERIVRRFLVRGDWNPDARRVERMSWALTALEGEEEARGQTASGP